MNREVRQLSVSRKTVENLKDLVLSGKKRYVRYDEGAYLYSMGTQTFIKIAKEAKAVVKIHGISLVNIDMVNDYIEDYARRNIEVEVETDPADLYGMNVNEDDADGKKRYQMES